MILKNEKQILQMIKYAPSLFIITVSLSIVFFLYYDNIQKFQIEKEKIHSEDTRNKKKIIKEQVNNIYDFIIREQRYTEDNLKKSLNEALQNAHVIATTLYENNQDKDKKEVQKIITDALRNIRFNEGRGYFFIYDKSANNIMHPITPRYEGKNFLQYKDSKGVLIFQDMLQVLEKNDEAYYKWYWTKPNEISTEKEKLGLIKKFKPYDWFIGTGEYLEDFEKQVKEKVLKHTNEIKYAKNGNIFISNYDSMILSHNNKNFVGKRIGKFKKQEEIKKTIDNLFEIAKNGEGYYSYIHTKIDNNLQTKKISFVKGVNNWSWIIGAGFYADDNDAEIQNRKDDLDKNFNNYILKVAVLSIFLTMILLFISINISKLLRDKFKKYKSEINQHIDNSVKQQNILSQQAKMAAMGEMIANIAHQWRQPLSTITVASTGMKLQKEMGVLEDEKLIDGLKSINKSAQHLSKTIDDFRNFFNTEKKKNSFKLESTINKAISLCESQFVNKNIEIVKNIDDVEIHNLENELIQVLINLLNNAREELEKTTEQRRLIFIDVKKEDDMSKLQIRDNAGGVPSDIIERIFEPYFTTKHKSQGTGIGLYMCKEIITKNMNSSISVENCEYKFDDVEYKGAMFEIVLI